MNRLNIKLQTDVITITTCLIWKKTTDLFKEIFDTNKKYKNTVIDGNGNRLSETNTYQNQTFIENFTYDSSELMSDFALPFADKTGFDYLTRSYPFFNKILSSETKSTNRERIVYNYDNLITLNLNSFTFENSFTIFPNPVKTDFNIEITGVIVHIENYNSLGLKPTTTKSTKYM